MHFGFLSAGEEEEEEGGVQRGTRSVEVDGPCNTTATASGWLSWLKMLNKRAGRKFREKARNFGWFLSWAI